MMGKKRAVSIRRIAERFLDSYSNKFTISYSENKDFLVEIMDFPTKKVRNQVAGSITRLKKIRSKDNFYTFPLVSPRSLQNTRRRRRRNG